MEVKLSPTVEEGGAPDELTLELARLIAEGSRASRTAFLAKLETQKVTRDDLSSLFEGTRLLLSSALLGQYGVSVPERILHRAVTGFALDKSQITRHNRFIAGLPQ